MIYVTVGNHDQPFDRLIGEMDRLAGTLGVETVIQKGVSRLDVKNASAKDYFSFEEAEEFYRKADVVVGHAGIGTVISARRWKTPLIICPRRKDRGEHFNDHQLEICGELLERKRPGVEVAMETEDVERKLRELLARGRDAAAGEYEDPSIPLKNKIREFLESV